MHALIRSAIAWLAAVAPLQAQEQAPQPSPAAAATAATAAAKPAAAPPAHESTCLLIEAAAQANGLPAEFFARLIWQESGFRPHVQGPVTRSGARAQGIAQFMPATAAERALLDPFDPVQALPKSAEFLRELRDEFGNLGLAAAAYNAGPRRVREWLAGTGSMPAETRNYVLAITGASVEDWASAGRDAHETKKPSPNCRQLIALLKRTPSAFIEALERRVSLAAYRPWGVQLSAGFSRARALASYARAAKQYARVLAGLDPIIIATRLRTRGTRGFYQVRIGADSRAEADALCNRIRRIQGACMVLRNPRRGR